MTKERNKDLPKLDDEGYCTKCKFRHPCECVPFCEGCQEPVDECQCIGPDDPEYWDDYGADDEAPIMTGRGTPQVDPFWMGDPK